MRLLTLLIVVGLSPMLAIAQVQTFRKEVRQVMGSAQSLDDARTAAIAKAKRDALEEAGTWLESRTEVRNLELARDDVTTLAGGIAQTRVLEEQPFVEGDAVGLRVVAEVRVDTSGLAERVRRLLADRERLEQARAVNAREKELLARLAALENQMAEMKARGESSATLRAAVQENAQRLTAKVWFTKGEALWDSRQGKYSNPNQAISYFSEALRLDPNDAFAYYNRGLAYVALGQHQLAIADYDQALRLEPDYAPTYVSRGISYFQMGQHQRAIEDYDQALRLEPDYAPAYALRGAAYNAMRLYERAIANFDQALRFDPIRASTYTRRGEVYANLGMYRRAVNDYNEAIRVDPDYAVAYFSRGGAYMLLGERSRAYMDWREACRLKYQAACEWLRKYPE